MTQTRTSVSTIFINALVEYTPSYVCCNCCYETVPTVLLSSYYHIFFGDCTKSSYQILKIIVFLNYYNVNFLKINDFCIK